MIIPHRRSLKRNFLRGLFLCKKALLLGVDKQKEICEAKHPLKTSPKCPHYEGGYTHDGRKQLLHQ